MERFRFMTTGGIDLPQGQPAVVSELSDLVGYP